MSGMVTSTATSNKSIQLSARYRGLDRGRACYSPLIVLNRRTKMGRPRKFTDTEKWCSRCKSWKTFENFTKHKGYRGGGYSSLCKPCAKERTQERPLRKANQKDIDRSVAWGRKNKDRRKEIMRDYLLRERYGLTPEEYKEMYDAQKGKCAIPSCDGRAEFIDHDHSTNTVRKLLCRLCNSALGFFKDNPTLMREGAEYVEKYRGQ